MRYCKEGPWSSILPKDTSAGGIWGDGDQTAEQPESCWPQNYMVLSMWSVCRVWSCWDQSLNHISISVSSLKDEALTSCEDFVLNSWRWSSFCGWSFPLIKPHIWSWDPVRDQTMKLWLTSSWNVFVLLHNGRNWASTFKKELGEELLLFCLFMTNSQVWCFWPGLVPRGGGASPTGRRSYGRPQNMLLKLHIQPGLEEFWVPPPRRAGGRGRAEGRPGCLSCQCDLTQRSGGEEMLYGKSIR